MQNYKAIVIGGGPSGITCSYYLKKYGLSHLLIERNDVLHTWKNERWDSFYLVTPNWMTNLPGMENELPYDNEYMSKAEIVSVLEAYVALVGPRVLSHTQISKIDLKDTLYEVTTNKGVFYAEHIIVATGMYSDPFIPDVAKDLPESVYQIHSSHYKNPCQLKKGNTLVVGSGWSGIQIALEAKTELGSEVFLSIGSLSALPTLYKNIHGVYWLNRLSGYKHEKPALSYRKEDFNNQNIVMKMRQNLKTCQEMGVHFLGRFLACEGDVLHFSDSIQESFQKLESDMLKVKENIERLIQLEKEDLPAGDLDIDLGKLNAEALPSIICLSVATHEIKNVIWSTGFMRSYDWIKRPVFDANGLPILIDGTSTTENIYFCGQGLEVDPHLKSAYGVGLYALDESARRAVMAILSKEGAMDG